MKNAKSLRKTNALWVALIAMPFIAMLVTALAQIIVHFITADSSGSLGRGVVTALNIISVLLGMFAVITLLCLPFWVVMLLKDRKAK